MLCPRNIHRMYLAGVMLAAKLMDDNVFNNPYWAKVRAASCQAGLNSRGLTALKEGGVSRPALVAIACAQSCTLMPVCALEPAHTMTSQISLTTFSRRHSCYMFTRLGLYGIDHLPDGQTSKAV